MDDAEKRRIISVFVIWAVWAVVVIDGFWVLG